MPLTRPTLNAMVAFDATQQQIFTFTVRGASAQIVSNTLTIRNNSTNDIVYQEEQQTFRYEHTLAAGTLTNGTYYNATVLVSDNEGNTSSESIPIQFWCYTTPVLEFTNIPTDNIIPNASFTFQFSYTQTESEALNSYTLALYNSSQLQIATSGVQYPVDGTPPYNGSYTFAGFEDNTVYYVQISGVTIEGTVVTSALHQFTIQYTRPDLFTLIELSNNCEGGYINISSNLILIEGTSNPDPPKYIDNEEVDLTDEGSYVEWTQGYSITGDMKVGLWFRNPTPYSILLQFSNASGQTITLSYMLGYQNLSSQNLEAFVEVHVKSIEGLEYYIYSNYITPANENEQYIVSLTRINDVYEVQLSTP